LEHSDGAFLFGIKENSMSSVPKEPFHPSTFPPFTGKRIESERKFKCWESGTKYVESFCSTDDVSLCRWCSGEEEEAGILE